MLQPDKAGQDIAPTSDDGLPDALALFRRNHVGGMPGKPFPYEIALGRVADDALINGIDLVLDRFKRLSGERRPDDPELFDSGALGEDVPASLDRFVGRNLGGAVIDGRDREDDSVIDIAAGGRPLIEQIKIASLWADKAELELPAAFETLCV